jgi:hypothetical protein
VKNAKTVEYEFMRIQETESGQLTFVASPSGQPEVAFGLVSLTATQVVFENREHDFPQRIIYWRAGASLQARIEGTQSGETRGVNFALDPVPCSEPATR